VVPTREGLPTQEAVFASSGVSETCRERVFRITAGGLRTALASYVLTRASVMEKHFGWLVAILWPAEMRFRDVTLPLPIDNS
jgi:hypothetical protein